MTIELQRENRQTGEMETFTIGVGDGATLVLPDDRYPYVITGFTKMTVSVRPVNTDNLEPEGKCNGFPVFNHTFTREELAERAYGKDQKAYRRKDGRYYLNGIVLSLYGARYYRNYAD